MQLLYLWQNSNNSPGKCKRKHRNLDRSVGDLFLVGLLVESLAFWCLDVEAVFMYHVGNVLGIGLRDGHFIGGKI